MFKNRIVLIAAGCLLSLTALTACSDHAAPTYVNSTAAPAAAAAPAAPVIVNAAPAANNGMSDMLVGGALGYALANAANGAGGARSAAPPTQHTIVNKTVVNKTVVVNKAAPPPPTPPTPGVNLAKAAAPDYRAKSAYQTSASTARSTPSYSSPPRTSSYTASTSSARR